MRIIKGHQKVQKSAQEKNKKNETKKKSTPKKSMQSPIQSNPSKRKRNTPTKIKKGSIPSKG
jgi:hypothetical protein